MDEQTINNTYWETTPKETIINSKAIPGEELLSLLQPNANILDVGCGDARLAEYLFQKGYQVTGIDINKHAIEANKTQNPNIYYKIADITKKIPFKDNTFDAIVISFVLVNIIDDTLLNRLVSEIQRVTKPGGYLWINEGLVSEDYTDRYTLSLPHTTKNYSFFVFKNPKDAKQTDNAQTLEQIIKHNGIKRIARHFDEKEITQAFRDCTLVSKTLSQTTSPNSGMTINMGTFVFQK